MATELEEALDVLETLPPENDVVVAYVSDIDVVTKAARRYANLDRHAAKTAFWAHAADLLKPTVSSTGIDRAVDLALDAALGVTTKKEEEKT